MLYLKLKLQTYFEKNEVYYPGNSDKIRNSVKM